MINEKRPRIHTLYLLYVQSMISVLDYGLRLTTMSQIDLPKLDRAEKNEVLVTVGATTDTLMVTMSRHARVSPRCKPDRMCLCIGYMPEWKRLHGN